MAPEEAPCSSAGSGTVPHIRLSSRLSIGLLFAPPGTGRPAPAGRESVPGLPSREEICSYLCKAVRALGMAERTDQYRSIRNMQRYLTLRLTGRSSSEEGPAMLRMRAGRGRIAWRVGNGAFVTGTCRFVNKARFRSGIGIVFQQNGHFCCPHCDKVVAFGFLPRAASSASRCLKGRGKMAVPQ